MDGGRVEEVMDGLMDEWLYGMWINGLVHVWRDGWFFG